MVNVPSQTPVSYFEESDSNDDWTRLPSSGDVEPDEWRSGSVVVRRVRTARSIRYSGHGRRVHIKDAPSDMGIRRLVPYTTLPGSTGNLRRRLDDANRHFRRKASAVLGDEDAVRLLAKVYQVVTLDLEEFDTCEEGIALAKLTAANFCEIGANVIYITEAGQSFIEELSGE